MVHGRRGGASKAARELSLKSCFASPLPWFRQSEHTEGRGPREDRGPECACISRVSGEVYRGVIGDVMVRSMNLEDAALSRSTALAHLLDVKTPAE